MLNSKWVKVDAISSQGGLQETNKTLEKLKADRDSFTRAVISTTAASDYPWLLHSWNEVYIPNKSDQHIHFLGRNVKSKVSYVRIASFSSKKSNDKVGSQYKVRAAYQVVTRTPLCCYITFPCDIARHWKGTCVYNVAAKTPKGKCLTF